MFRNTNFGVLMRKVGGFYGFNWRSLDYFCFFAKSKPTKNRINMNNHQEHEFVDLGLPSGTLWATCNVGAKNPEDCGDFFAWGEIKPKTYYDYGTYKYCKIKKRLFKKNDWLFTKYCGQAKYGYGGFTDNRTILLPEDDASAAYWGNGWRMPTKEELEELYSKTIHTWTTQNGVYGRRFTARNGNSIFLPYAGFRFQDGFVGFGNNGYYWSSSLSTDNPYCASYFYSRFCGHFRFGSPCFMIDWGSNRASGLPVRAVRSEY